MGNILTSPREFGTPQTVEQKRVSAELKKSAGQRARENQQRIADGEKDIEDRIAFSSNFRSQIKGILTGEQNESRTQFINNAKDITPANDPSENQTTKTNTVSSNSRPSVLSLAGSRKRTRRSILGTDDTVTIGG